MPPTSSVAGKTEVQAAMSALKGECFDTLFERCKTFIRDSNKKWVETGVVTESTDINDFNERLMAYLKGGDGNHLLVDHLAKLNAEHIEDLYDFLGKAMLDEQIAAQLKDKKPNPTTEDVTKAATTETRRK